MANELKLNRHVKCVAATHSSDHRMCGDGMEQLNAIWQKVLAKNSDSEDEAPSVETMRKFKERFRNIRLATKAERRSLVAEAFRLACFAGADAAMWAEICRDPMFRGRKQRPNLKRPDDALRWTLRLLRGYDQPGTRSASDFVHEWLRALLPLWRADVTGEHGAALIRKHGLKVGRRFQPTEMPKQTTEFPIMRPAIIRVPHDAGGREIAKLAAGKAIRLRIIGNSGKSITAKRIKKPASK